MAASDDRVVLSSILPHSRQQQELSLLLSSMLKKLQLAGVAQEWT
jgi:hypothetical protein